MGQVKDLVEAWWSAFEAGDLDATKTYTHEDIEFRMPGAELRGQDQIRELLAGYDQVGFLTQLGLMPEPASQGA